MSRGLNRIPTSSLAPLRLPHTLSPSPSREGGNAVIARPPSLTKRRVYQRESVEYWIIDIDAKVVERWRPGDERPEILAERVEWQPDDRDPAWVLELDSYFDAVQG